jgi:hypothetical protein
MGYGVNFTSTTRKGWLNPIRAARATRLVPLPGRTILPFKLPQMSAATQNMEETHVSH